VARLAGQCPLQRPRSRDISLRTALR
jgi:hypothetical protein